MIFGNGGAGLLVGANMVRLTSSFFKVEKNDSAIALSEQAPVRPIDAIISKPRR